MNSVVGIAPKGGGGTGHYANALGDFPFAALAGGHEK